MDIDPVNFALYFVVYLVIGFIFFYFTLLKKKGSNFVGTLCLILVFVLLAIGFIKNITGGIINLFILILSMWFSYLIMKMHRDEKIAEEKARMRQQKLYQQRIKRKRLTEE